MSLEMDSKQQLHQRVQESLRKAENNTVKLRQTNMRLVIGGLASSAATTLVAGGTALQGPQVGLGTSGWQMACIVAAFLSFVSTICAGLIQQLKLDERLSEGQICVARLRALDLALVTGSRAWEDVAKEYEEIVKVYAAILS